MSNFTTKENVRALAEKDFSKLNNSEKKKIMIINELACHIKHGFPDCAVYDTEVGRVKVESYGDYADLLNLSGKNHSKYVDKKYLRRMKYKEGKK